MVQVFMPLYPAQYLWDFKAMKLTENSDKKTMRSVVSVQWLSLTNYNDCQCCRESVQCRCTEVCYDTVLGTLQNLFCTAW